MTFRNSLGDFYRKEEEKSLLSWQKSNSSKKESIETNGVHLRLEEGGTELHKLSRLRPWRRRGRPERASQRVDCSRVILR